MSKQEQKDYTKYGYIGNEEITMTPQEFYAIRVAFEKAVQNGITEIKPVRYSYVSKKTNKIVKKATQKQIESGEVYKIMDIDKTADPENLEINFNPNLFPEIMNTRDVVSGIHKRMVDKGVAVHEEEIKKHYEQKKEAPLKKVVEDNES